MLQDFRRAQHLNLETDGDGLSHWPACTRHSENTAVLAVQRPRHKTSLSTVSPSCFWASSAPGKQLLEAAGLSCTPAVQTGLEQEIPGWNAVETRTDPGKTGSVDLQGEWSTELGVGRGIHTHIAQRGQGTDKKWS